MSAGPVDAFPRREGDEGPQSMMGAERVIHWILSSVVEVFKSKPQYVDRILRLFPPEEVEQVKTILKEQPLLVVHGFPRQGMLPEGQTAICSVLLGNDSMDMALLSDYMGYEELDAFNECNFGEAAAVLEGQLDNQEISIWLWAKHPDVLHYYYALVRSILIGGHKVLLARQIQPVSFSANDVQPSMEYLPQFAFIRRIAYNVRGTKVSAFDAQTIQTILIEAKVLQTDLSETVYIERDEEA